MADDQAFHTGGAQASECRALTVQASSIDDRRPLAGFVTQLIACDRRLGAYRRSRREEPAGAALAYGSGADRHLAHLALDVTV